MRGLAVMAAFALLLCSAPAIAKDTFLVGLLYDPNGGPVTLQHLNPMTLEPSESLRIAWDTYNPHPLDISGGLLAVRTKEAVAVIDAARLRVIRSYPLRTRPGDVCAVGLDGASPVALLGCRSATAHRYTIAWLRSSVRVVTRRALDPIGYPVSFAFGDGEVFVSREYGAVDAIDLHTGAVRSHRPLRALSKGEEFVRAGWLADHLLGLSGTVVDVRTWRKRVLAAHAQETVAGGDKLATYGPGGVAVFTRAGFRFYRRLLAGQYVDQARLVGNVLYARVGLVWEVIDVRTGRSTARVVPDSGENLWLIGTG